MKNSVSFVILNYNDANTVDLLMAQLLNWNINSDTFHLVIVDNQSTDCSFEYLYKKYKDIPFVDVIRSEKNGGYSYGNNFGAKFAIEKYNPKFIVISNPDIVIDCNTFQKLLETFEFDRKIAVTSPVMMDLNGNYKIRVQRLPEFKDDVAACSIKEKFHNLSDLKQHLESNENALITQMLPGSFFVIRADVFKEIGYLDENVFLYCEERILGKKILDAGYIQILRKDLFFTHAHSTSIKKTYNIIQTWKMIMKSRMYYQKQYNHISKFQEIKLKRNMNNFIFILSIKLKLIDIFKKKK